MKYMRTKGRYTWTDYTKKKNSRN